MQTLPSTPVRELRLVDSAYLIRQRIMLVLSVVSAACAAVVGPTFPLTGFLVGAAAVAIQAVYRPLTPVTHFPPSPRRQA